MNEYRFIGVHADELDGGRPIAPGEYTGPIEISEDFGHNRDLYEDGLLLEVKKGTAERVRKIDAAAVGEDVNPNADGTPASNEGEDN